MKVDKKALLLYAVTDRSWSDSETFIKQIEECIQGGVTFLQLREKNMEEEAFLKLAKQIKQVADAYRIPFVINDDVSVALAADADGVHVGQEDTKTKTARKMIGKDKILGVSVQTVDQAIQAEKEGADYLGVGAVFSTSTKADAENVSLDTLKEICKAVTIPVVAIGGIHEENMPLLKDSGICGVAVVSAIFAKKEIKAAAEKLKKMAGELF